MSATAKTAKPAAMNSHVRPGRQPVDGDHGEDEGQQREVAERVAEVRRDRRERSLGARDDAEHERRADRGHRERGDEAVEPERGRHPAGAGAEQQDEADVRGRVDGEVAGVGGGRERRRVERLEHGRPVDVAGEEGAEADAEGDPGGALGARRPGGADGAARRPRRTRWRCRTSPTTRAAGPAARSRRRRARSRPGSSRPPPRAGASPVLAPPGSTSPGVIGRRWRFLSGAGPSPRGRAPTR